MRHVRNVVLTSLLLLVGLSLGQVALQSIGVIAPSVPPIQQRQGESDEQFRERSEQEISDLLKQQQELTEKTNVYVTRTGKEVYHLDGCYHLRHSQFLISPPDAKRENRRPAMKCDVREAPSIDELMRDWDALQEVNARLRAFGR